MPGIGGRTVAVDAVGIQTGTGQAVIQAVNIAADLHRVLGEVNIRTQAEREFLLIAQNITVQRYHIAFRGIALEREVNIAHVDLRTVFCLPDQQTVGDTDTVNIKRPFVFLFDRHRTGFLITRRNRGTFLLF